MLQVLLGHHHETRWLRRARKDNLHLFLYLPKQPGYTSGYEP